MQNRKILSFFRTRQTGDAQLDAEGSSTSHSESHLLHLGRLTVACWVPDKLARRLPSLYHVGGSNKSQYPLTKWQKSASGQLFQTISSFNRKISLLERVKKQLHYMLW